MSTTHKKLEDLFDVVADTLLDALKSGEASASILSVARQFLKDNNIEARPTKGSPLGNLADSLPTFSPDPTDDDADEGSPFGGPVIRPN